MVSRRARGMAAYVLAVAVLIGVSFWGGALLRTSTGTPQILTGTVGEVGISGDEFSVLLSHTDGGDSYGLSDSIPWRDSQGTWNYSVGSPIACMKPLSHGQQITFGVVTTKPVGDAPGTQVVVWLECPT